MIQTIVTAAILYIATALDLLVILLMFFARARTRKEYRDIYIGQYVYICDIDCHKFILCLCLKLCSEKMDIRIIRVNTDLFRN